MTGNDSPREEEPMTDAGIVDERGLVEPVAVGPGDPVTNGHAGTGDGIALSVPEPARAADGLDGASTGLDGAADGLGAAIPVVALSSADASLLALIDRLGSVLERGDLGELEVSSGGTTIILRAPSAVAAPVALAAAPLAEIGGSSAMPAADPTPAPAAPDAARPSVRAPLTGIYYGAPSPGATAYVAVGDHVSVGQIIGLIEAMKLFNEIKSDLAGRVVRICVDSGALVKAKQPLIEVEPG
jgi:acetyl-CoA carboxylase biotin carboxyl carrier protein